MATLPVPTPTEDSHARATVDLLAMVLPARMSTSVMIIQTTAVPTLSAPTPAEDSRALATAASTVMA